MLDGCSKRQTCAKECRFEHTVLPLDDKPAASCNTKNLLIYSAVLLLYIKICVSISTKLSNRPFLVDCCGNANVRWAGNCLICFPFFHLCCADKRIFPLFVTQILLCRVSCRDKVSTGQHMNPRLNRSSVQ